MRATRNFIKFAVVGRCTKSAPDAYRAVPESPGPARTRNAGIACIEKKRDREHGKPDGTYRPGKPRMFELRKIDAELRDGKRPADRGGQNEKQGDSEED
tara:strand:+ start:1865 stop:2161 length:297 start_codon:yes stop_codon:yes gene_type:complete